MFREFKFKVWDLQEKEMIITNALNYETSVSFKPDEEISLINHPYWYRSIDKFPTLFIPCVLMQYTGNLDKNAVEIYEYDIVKRTYDEFDFDTNSYVSKEQISYVHYLERGFWVNDESFGWEGENLWNWNNIEVIGNLYENPELYFINK